MKKFRLIKEYPGSAIIDSIATLYISNHFNVKDTYNVKQPNGTSHLDISKYTLEKYPEFWEEIIEVKKDYEILSFTMGISLLVKNNLKDESDFYTFRDKAWDGNKHRNEDFLLKNKSVYKIHSIKRLSDGEIFSLGDKTGLTNGNGNRCPILSFEISYNEERGHLEKYRNKETLKFTLGTGYESKDKWGPFELDLLRPVKQKLFTTEDGVDIYQGDKYYAVNCGYHIIESSCKESEISSLTDIKRFSTKKAAEDYIIMNKPVLSLKEVLDNYNLNTNSYSDVKKDNELIQLVKSKLK